MPANVILSPHEIAVVRFDRNDQSQFERLGFIFGDMVDLSGKTYRRVHLPMNWIAKQDNDFQAEIYDEHNQVRALLSANVDDDRDNGSLYLRPRYFAGTYELIENDRTRVVGRAQEYTEAGFRTVFETSPVNLAVLNFPGNINAQRALFREAEQWLDAHYPDWRNPLAYWE